jgi:hypothetical protein
MCFMHIGIFFFLILDVQKVDVINETREMSRQTLVVSWNHYKQHTKERVTKDMSFI